MATTLRILLSRALLHAVGPVPPEAPAPAETRPEPANRSLFSRPGWHAMPGQRIELSDTGFSIVMDLRPGADTFTLIDPEGRTLAYGPILPGLKDLGERMAAMREEFVFKGYQP
jgi:hypothetical protein